MPPLSPGDVLVAKYINPRGLTVPELAEDIRVPVQKIVSIVTEHHRITAEIAIRLARYFGTAPEFWMDIQTAYDLDKANKEIGKLVEREVLPILSMAHGA